MNGRHKLPVFVRAWSYREEIISKNSREFKIALVVNDIKYEFLLWKR